MRPLNVGVPVYFTVQQGVCFLHDLPYFDYFPVVRIGGILDHAPLLPKVVVQSLWPLLRIKCFTFLIIHSHLVTPHFLIELH